MIFDTPEPRNSRAEAYQSYCRYCLVVGQVPMDFEEYERATAAMMFHDLPGMGHA